MSVLALKNISKCYDNGIYAVKDFNLEVDENEFVIFVGPSGCGKTTTLRMIAGLEEISKGQLWLDNNLINFVEPKDRKLSMVFQNYALYPHMNVYENLAFSLRVKKVNKKEIDKKVRKVAKILKIEEILDRKPKTLSGGQRQRVAIGSAIIQDAKVFLMDEPLSNLDAKLRSQMRVELAKIHKELKSTIIYVTHDQVEAMTLATKIVVMKDGLIQQTASPKEIYERPKNKFIAGFMGNPSMNFFVGTSRKSDEMLEIGVANGKVVPDKNTENILIQKGYANSHIIVGIRPEDMIIDKLITYEEYDGLMDMQMQNTKDGLTLRAKVLMRELLGNDAIIHFIIDENEYMLKAPADMHISCNDIIEISIQKDRLHFFDIDTEENIIYGD